VGTHTRAHTHTYTRTHTHTHTQHTHTHTHTGAPPQKCLHGVGAASEILDFLVELIKKDPTQGPPESMEETIVFALDMAHLGACVLQLCSQGGQTQKLFACALDMVQLNACVPADSSLEICGVAVMYKRCIT